MRFKRFSELLLRANLSIFRRKICRYRLLLRHEFVDILEIVDVNYA